MLNRQKIISLLVLMAFTLQGCARGVTPTGGMGNLTSTTPESEVQRVISEQICLLEGDSDSDGDTICDADDVAENGYDCSQDPNCMVPGQNDQFSKPEKSKWWLYVGGALVLAGGASWIAKEISGDWWWNKIGSNADANDEANLVKFYKRNQATGAIQLNAFEDFFSLNNEVHALVGTSTIVKDVGGMYYSLSPFDGPRIKRGSTVMQCMNGVLGHQYMGVEGGAHKALVSYQLGSDFKKIRGIKKQTLNEVMEFCRQNKGMFLAYETNPDGGDFYITAIPTKMMSGFNEAGGYLNAEYLFDSLPTTVTANVTEIRYHRANPYFDAQNPGANDQTFDHFAKFNQAGATAYNACGNVECRLDAIFANTAGIEVTSHGDEQKETERAAQIKQDLPTHNESELFSEWCKNNPGHLGC